MILGKLQSVKSSVYCKTGGMREWTLFFMFLIDLYLMRKVNSICYYHKVKACFNQPVVERMPEKFSILSIHNCAIISKSNLFRHTINEFQICCELFLIKTQNITLNIVVRSIANFSVEIFTITLHHLRLCPYRPLKITCFLFVIFLHDVDQKL